MSFNQNQFAKGPVVGQIDQSRGGINNALSLRIDPDSSAADVVAGTGVKFVDGGANDAGGLPYVDVISGDTDEATAGVILWTPKQGEFQPKDIIQAAQNGDIVWMKAAGALARGVNVALDQSAPGYVQALSTNAKIGRLIDKASAADDLVRVIIETAAA